MTINPLSKIRQKKGFTLIELMIAISVLVILSSLVVVNYSEARKAARDSRRKSDVRTYVSALNSYHIANGNFFITTKDGNCDLPSDTDKTTSSSFEAATGTGCTGALGRSYGKLNLKATSNGVNQDFQRAYASTSIAEALQSRGYLGTVAKDPSNSNASNTSDSASDYMLVRCCSDGTQAYRKSGQMFAVWTRLENTTQSTDATNSAKYCGGAKSYSTGGYYDFATGFDGQNSTDFGVGNAFPGGVQASVGSCSSGS